MPVFASAAGGADLTTLTCPPQVARPTQPFPTGPRRAKPDSVDGRAKHRHRERRTDKKRRDVPEAFTSILSAAPSILRATRDTAPLQDVSRTHAGPGALRIAGSRLAAHPASRTAFTARAPPHGGLALSGILIRRPIRHGPDDRRCTIHGARRQIRGERGRRERGSIRARWPSGVYQTAPQNVIKELPAGLTDGTRTG